MADFEVLNVGQGDSILLRPSSGCRYGGETVFIDLGPGRYDITENIESLTTSQVLEKLNLLPDNKIIKGKENVYEKRMPHAEK